MENSKIILATLIVLTLLVGGLSGYLIAGNNQPLQRQDDFKKLMMLKAITDARQNGPRQEHQRDRDPHKMMTKTRDSDRARNIIKHMQNKQISKEQMARKKGEMFLKIMAKKCSLTEEQQKQVKVILNKSKAELQTAKNEFKGKLNIIKNKADAQIENILTDAQKAEFKELKENARKYRMQQSKIRNNTLKNYALRKQALSRESARSFR